MSAAGREVSFSGEAGLNSAPACIPVEDLRPGARARGARPCGEGFGLTC